MAIDDQERGSAGDPAVPDGACAACRASIARFVEGSAQASERERMVAHLRGCEECAEAYGRTLRSAADLGRAGRERRLAAAARARRETQRDMALSAGTRPRPRARVHQLRLVLVPALFALLVVLVGRAPARGTRVVWEAGTVEAAGRALDAELAEVRVGRGTWCRTRAGAAARVEAGGSVLRLGGDTTIRVESAAGAPRVRLHSGHLSVRGEAEVSTTVGVFSSGGDAAGRLAWEREALVVTWDRGELRYTGPLGSGSVPAGGVRTFEGIR